jgi:non-specific serine/threonine protein kinase
VKDDIYSTFYKVYIQKIKDPKSLSVRCTCPTISATFADMKQRSLFQLQEMIDKNMLDADDVEYDQRHTVAKMKFIDLKSFEAALFPGCIHRGGEISPDDQSKH